MRNCLNFSYLEMAVRRLGHEPPWESTWEVTQERFARKQFQTSGKIINDFPVEMGFYWSVNRIGQHLYRVPACNGGRLGGLIVVSSQHGADL